MNWQVTQCNPATLKVDQIAEKFAELKQELDHLKTVRRKEVAESLEYARSLGDLSDVFEQQSNQGLGAGSGALAGLLLVRGAASRLAGPRLQQAFAILSLLIAAGLAARALA